MRTAELFDYKEAGLEVKFPVFRRSYGEGDAAGLVRLAFTKAAVLAGVLLSELKQVQMQSCFP